MSNPNDFLKYTRVTKIGNSWSTYLQIGVQGFTVVADRTKNEAQWYAKMLATALAHLVDEMAEEKNK